MKISLDMIRPVGKRMLIEGYKNSEMTESGLVLAEAENSTLPVLGKVVAAGDESVYKVGETVMFRKYSVDEIKFTSDVGEVSVSLVEDEEVVGIVTI